MRNDVYLPKIGSKFKRVIDLPKIISERGENLTEEQINDEESGFVIKEIDNNCGMTNIETIPDEDSVVNNFIDVGAKKYPLEYESSKYYKTENKINLKLYIFIVFTFIIKQIALGFVNLYHLFYNKQKKIEYHNLNNFETKLTKTQKLLLSISTPDYVFKKGGKETLRLLQICYPLLSKSHLQELIIIRKNQYEIFSKVFGWNGGKT